MSNKIKKRDTGNVALANFSLRATYRPLIPGFLTLGSIDFTGLRHERRF